VRPIGEASAQNAERKKLTAVNLGAHETILRVALGHSGEISAAALNWLVLANKCSDIFQWAPERHFDSAPDPDTVCLRWRDGLQTFLTRAVDLSAPMPGLRGALRRWRALAALGAATHALADFYAHTNWIELAVASGQPESLAPLLGATCENVEFPAELQSGYFGMRYGLSGCPHVDGRPNPPAGYRYCHLQLAKDYATHGHGADKLGPHGPTFYELAISLATRATCDMWKNFRQRIVASYGAQTAAW
jgi:hypothetical protein